MNPSRGGIRRRTTLLLGVLCLSSCADHKATALVIAFSADPGVKGVIKHIEISAYRGSEPSFEQPYDIPADAQLPATLTFSKKDGAPDSQSVLYKIVGMDETGKPRITKQARLGFTKEHTKLLRMPLEQSCLDHKPCNPDETCAHGMCISDSVDPAGLPDFTSNGDVLSTGGAAGAAGSSGTSGAAGSAGTSGSGGTSGAAGGVVGCTTPSTSADGSLSLGIDHSCAILKGGTVSCWGSAESVSVFQSDPDFIGYYSIATPVPLPSAVYTKVSSGEVADCAITDAGALTCWVSSNYYGILGVTGDATGAATTIDAHVIDVTVGAQHACAIVGASDGATTGEVECWGTNANGQIGVAPDDIPGNHPTPQNDVGVSNAVELSCGLFNDLTCARLSTGAVTCWGATADHWQPGPALATGAVEIAVGDTLYYRNSAGLVFAVRQGPDGIWGAPSQLTNLGAVSKIDASSSLCGVDASDSKVLHCVELPYSSTGEVETYTFLSPIKDISVGANLFPHTLPYECVTLEDGGIRCRGSDNFGMTGLGSIEDVRTPSVVELGGNNPVSLSTSSASTIVQMSDGSFWAWGRNQAFFNDSGVRSPSLTNLTPVDETVTISSDIEGEYAYLLGPTARRTLVNGQLESTAGGLFANPDASFTASKVLRVAAGASESTVDLGATATDLFAYITVTSNDSHLLPDDPAQGGPSYQTLIQGVSVKEIAYRSYGFDSDTDSHACVRLDTGEARCWGANGSGETGQPVNSMNVWPPAVVKTEMGATLITSSICAGQEHSCAVDTTNTVYCWGANSYHQSRPMSSDTSALATPTAVTALMGTVEAHVSCGNFSTCVWTSTTLSCWGANLNGQVGNPGAKLALGAGLNKVQNMPPTGFDTILDVSLSNDHACALVSGNGSNAVVCWGGNINGAVGVGVTGEYPAFERVCGVDAP